MRRVVERAGKVECRVKTLVIDWSGVTAGISSPPNVYGLLTPAVPDKCWAMHGIAASERNYWSRWRDRREKVPITYRVRVCGEPLTTHEPICRRTRAN